VIGAALANRGARRVVIPDGLTAPWAAAAEVPLAESRVSGRDGLALLDTADVVVTTVTVAIAQTGTLVLDHGPGQGRRELTLIPDIHLAVVPPGRVVAAPPTTWSLTWSACARISASADGSWPGARGA
jgi:L-lactate dehydrogenase complex protein LldG